MDMQRRVSGAASKRRQCPLVSAWVLSAMCLAVALNLLSPGSNFLMLALGAAQTALLWRRLPRAGYWLAATVIGFGPALLLWDVSFNQVMQIDQLFPGVRTYPLLNDQISISVASGFDWAFIAAAQWFAVLRRGLDGPGKRHAAGWIAASALGGLLYGAVLGRYTMPSPHMDWLVTLVDRHVLPLPIATSAINAVAAASYALPSGLALAWLLRHQVKARTDGAAAFTIGRVTVSIAGK